MRSVGQRRRSDPAWHMAYAVSSLTDEQLEAAFQTLIDKIGSGNPSTWLYRTLQFVRIEQQRRRYLHYID